MVYFLIRGTSRKEQKGMIITHIRMFFFLRQCSHTGGVVMSSINKNDGEEIYTVSEERKMYVFGSADGVSWFVQKADKAQQHDLSCGMGERSVGMLHKEEGEIHTYGIQTYKQTIKKANNKEKCERGRSSGCIVDEVSKQFFSFEI